MFAGNQKARGGRRTVGGQGRNERDGAGGQPALRGPRSSQRGPSQNARQTPRTGTAAESLVDGSTTASPSREAQGQGGGRRQRRGNLPSARHMPNAPPVRRPAAGVTGRLNDYPAAGNGG